MSKTSSVQVVCFDLGGVLIRICRSWEEGCQAAGIAMRDESVLDPNGANGALEVSRLHQTGRIDHDEFLRRVTDSRKGAYAMEDVRRIHAAWILGEYPGVGEVIDRIHAAGLRTAALSNTNHAHWTQLQQYPALKRLHVRLASHELGLVKPDEAIYREAERRFGCAGERILFFDDLAENIAAARRIGWRAVQVDHTGDTSAQFAHALKTHGVLV